MAFLKEYEKIQMIGKGSFAKIWKVRHIKLGYVRAIKVSNELVDDENDPAYQAFLNECKVLLKIGNGSHPNIVHIYKPDLIENQATVEMDYVDGETLDEYLRRVGFIKMDEVYRFINEIVRALAYCHHDIYKFLMNPNDDNLQPDPNDGRKYIIDENKKRELVKKYAVVHNDLHSNNVMRRNYDGSFVLLDFGLAIQNGKAVKSSSRRGGALEYMPPEKFDNTSLISTQSDIYSLGVLMYEILAGRVPFVLDQQNYDSNPTAASYDMMIAHKTAIPPSIVALRREAFEKANQGRSYVKDYPDWLEEVIMKCLEKNPADRYTDAKELFNDIKRLKEQDATADDIQVDALRNENNNINQQLNALNADNNALKNKIDELKTINQNLLTENEELKKCPPKTVEVEKIVEKPVEKIVEKRVEVPVEKIVYKKKGRVGWIISTVLLLLISIALGVGMGYFAYLYEETDWELYQAREMLTQDTTVVDSSEQQTPIYDENTISLLEQQIAELQTRNQELEEQLGNASLNSGNTSDLQQQVNGLRSELATEKAKVAAEKSKVAAKQAEIQSKDATIKRLTDALNK